MLHLIHPALPRAAALDPYRLRHLSLLVASALVGLSLMLSATVSTSLAAATESAEIVPPNQLFVAAPDEADALAAVSTLPTMSVEGDAEAPAAVDPAALPPVAPPAREEFTIDERPPLVYPVGAAAPLGSPYGPRAAPCASCPSLHKGVDWNPGYGYPVVSIADGVVSMIGNPRSALGVHLEIEHIVNGQPITSVYAHLVGGSIPLSVGDEVRVGDPVGQVGSTGLVTGPHLHFELRVDGVTINPVPWMRANGAQ